MRWNYYKLRQLSLLQSAMDSYYKLRQLFITKCDTVYYKLRQVLQSAMNLLQIATGITKCDNYFKLRQVLQSTIIITNCDSTPKCKIRWKKNLEVAPVEFEPAPQLAPAQNLVL